MENLQGGTLSLEHRYRVQARQGRFALVTRYHGEQLPFERPVWVEVYDPLYEVGADTRVYERVKTSAHQTHQLDAEGILRTLDYGEIDKGVPFVVSERTEGPSLHDYLQEHGPLPPGDVVEMVERIGEALDKAHRANLTHGTLSTEWIYLQDGDPSRPKIGHFQVGLTLGELRRMDGAVLTPEVVQAYPPETFETETIPPAELSEDHDPTDEFTVAADVYALGAIVYEALVGFHPFFDDDDDPTDASDGIVRVQNDDPRPLADFGVEEGISEAVSRALSRSPGQRFSSAGAFARDLARAHGKTKKEGPPATDTDHGSETDDEFAALDAPSAADLGPDEPTDFSDTSDDLQPGGPASLLTTLAIAALIGTNVAWFFYALDDAGDAPTTEPTRPAPIQTDKIRLDSRPNGATVYVEGREKPLGETPLNLPRELFEATPVRLDLRKTGYRDKRFLLQQHNGQRQFLIPLEDEATE